MTLDEIKQKLQEIIEKLSNAGDMTEEEIQEVYEEIQELYEMTPGDNDPEFYEKQVKEQIKKNSRHYAKRQYTFFNHQFLYSRFSISNYTCCSSMCNT